MCVCVCCRCWVLLDSGSSQIQNTEHRDSSRACSPVSCVSCVLLCVCTRPPGVWSIRCAPVSALVMGLVMPTPNRARVNINSHTNVTGVSCCAVSCGALGLGRSLCLCRGCASLGPASLSCRASVLIEKPPFTPGSALSVSILVNRPRRNAFHADGAAPLRPRRQTRSPRH